MPMKPLREEVEGEDLESLKKDELLERAAKLDVAGRSQMTKDELIEAIEEAEADQPREDHPDSSV